MNIKEIATADCSIDKVIKNQNSILIQFGEIYYLRDNCFRNNVVLKIMNWSNFLIKLFVQKRPFGSVEELVLNENEFESFEVIQDINFDGEKLILKGFSKESGNWMIYEFSDYEYIIESK